MLGRTRLFLLALLALTAFTAPAANAAPGQLDPSFGSGGVVRLLPSEETILIFAVAAQADGKVVLAGRDEAAGVILVRLLENGALDPGFGAGGRVTTPFAGFGEARAVTIQPDGRIVVVGSAQGVVNTDFMVARYLPGGALDASFGGGDGIALVPVGGGEDEANAVALGIEGRILVTGRAPLPSKEPAMGVAVLLADGSLDPAFNGGAPALYTTEAGQDTGVAVAGLPDGRILLGNSNGAGGGDGFTLLRLLPSGVGDPSFGGDGSVETPIPVGGQAMNSSGRVTGLVMRPDGRIVASGYGLDYGGNPPNYESKWAAVGYLPNGDLDPGFGSGGIFTRQLSPGGDAAGSIALAPSGRLLLAGSYAAGDADAVAALELGPTGQLVPSFGVGGIFQRPERAPFGDSFEGAALDPYERLVIAATAYVGGGNTELVVIRLGDPLPPAAAPVNKAPHARMKRVPKKVKSDRLNGFVGTADDPDGALARVQVAVTKVVRGGAKASARRGAPKCLAMKNAQAKFKPAAPKGPKGKKRCQPRWLDVKGTAKWGFKLKRDLAPGKYVVYARAIDAAGLTETSFTRKAGNRYAFRVLPAD